MHRDAGDIRFSGSDLLHYLECEHLTTLDRMDLDTPLPRAAGDVTAALLEAKGREHETAWRRRLEADGIAVVDLSAERLALEERAARTVEAMRKGAPVIYQAAFLCGGFVGQADFLRRVARPSGLGSYGYEVLDAKLARSPKAKFVIQLCLYSELLGVVQGTLPRMMHLALGDGSEQTLRVADFFRYYRAVKARFLEHVRAHPDTYPEPCAHCDLCQWRELCEAQWRADDHLNRVAGITRAQMRRLQVRGVGTLAQLGTLPEDAAVAGIHGDTLARLRHQAALQLAARCIGEPRYELLAPAAGGLARLPRPDAGDVFFDMEGDPYEPGGLEYLFGVYWREGDAPRYRAFWAHDRRAERRAFEAFIDFVAQRAARYPDMHVYHYGHYEESALKRLMSLHGTREAQVDDLLRRQRLVDLYKIVRAALRVSEPRYSLKNLEVFYMDGRSGAVTRADESIVWYERWRESGEGALLDQIRAYNEDDCRSTWGLREWLLTLRPGGLAWPQAAASDEPRAEGKAQQAERRLAAYGDRLLGGLPGERGRWGPQERIRELVYQLLDFHRRAAKPEWWAMFARQEMSEAELVEDAECIGALERDPDEPPEPDKRSFLYTFRFPEQEFKLRAGDACRRADTGEPLGTILRVDERAGLLTLKVGARRGEPPVRLSLIPAGPVDTGVLSDALYRFADALAGGEARYRAVRSILEKAAPRIRGRAPGEPVVRDARPLVREIIEVAAGLDHSHLFIQGPPGAGKTFTGAQVIVALLRRGLRVGVSSNSHKAINHLLAAVERRAEADGVRFTGVKKSVKPGDDSCLGGACIADVFTNDAAVRSGHQLVAGTAWLFARPELDGTLDYLVVDEAGQVALANLVAMGTSARNIVLLGDQMQLGQPVQGVHPGRSGESVLDYLLDGAATIAPDRGAFLSTTWRMHENVCRFISEAVYDGRLQPEPANQRQGLVLRADHHPELCPSGIRFVEVRHEGCSQRSEVEAAVVEALYTSLREQSWCDRQGRVRRMGSDDILVVAPYNLQVNLLRRVLPEGARVGTVDKFQGQEAAVVIVSLATSSAEHLPRNIEFLYDKNRLNVAISRARCLSLVVASPALTSIRCTTVKEVELVNTLCWVREYAQRFATEALADAV
jgi:predicted RecB family nuclease